MIVFDYIGQALGAQKITPGNTATGLDVNCYTYKEWNVQCDGVDAGSTAAGVVAGTWVVGQTSAATAIVVSATLDSGAWGNANARVTLRVRSLSGTFTAAEDLGAGANLNHLTIRAACKEVPAMDGYMYQGMQARYALVTITGAVALVCFDGSIPNQTALIGQPMTPYASLPLKDINDIRNFKVIDYTAGSASSAQVTYFF
jgi:hypothetical protein